MNKYNDPPTPEFIDEVWHRVRAWGWGLDFTELTYFVDELRGEIGLPPIPDGERRPFEDNAP